MYSFVESSYIRNTCIYTYHTYTHIYRRSERNSLATGPLVDLLSYGIFRQREADMVTGTHIYDVCMMYGAERTNS